ncbi:glycosyltransferase [Cytophagaceae bacterium ABcell3]|nr:glycosyltransferase [Cytophagaceae bacterium ABcell3]
METKLKWTEKPVIRAEAPTPGQQFVLRALIFGGVVSIVVFLVWFFSEPRMGYAPLYWPLTAVMVFKLIRMIHEWYHYYDISIPEKPVQDKDYKVDMLTTFCEGEPYEMIERTLIAMKAVRYPHKTYLCDEADDPYLREFCKQHDVVHVTRTEKVNAKAGNINNALKQADGEICVILDPDHEPHPDFLHRVLPYFEDPKLGYAQCVQGYHNHRESLVAFGAAEQTYHFYGPMMMAMNSYGTAQAIGANCTFRRAALDSIGGHAPGLAEDMHTSMRIHAEGWKSIYVPEVLSKGQVPSSLSSYYKQQLKWSRGTFDLLFYVLPSLFSKLTWRQKLHYSILPLYFLGGVMDMFNILIPILALVLSEFPWRVDLLELSAVFLPLLVFTLLIRQYSQRWLMEKHEKGLHLTGGLLRIGAWWVYTLGFVYTIFKIKVPYIPTPKDDTPQNEWKLAIPGFVALSLSLVAIVYGLNRDWNPYTFFMAGLASVNVLILTFSMLSGQQKLMLQIRDFFAGTEKSEAVTRPVRVWLWHIRYGFYDLLRFASPVFAIAVVIGVGGYFYLYEKETPMTVFKKKLKDTGGFFTGVYMPEVYTKNAYNHEPIAALENEFQTKFSLVSLTHKWVKGEHIGFSDTPLKLISDGGGYPFVTLEPWPDSLALNKGGEIFKEIHEGKHDKHIEEYARAVQELGSPLFIRFAPAPDNPLKVWSEKYGCTSEDYIKAWRYVVSLFHRQGASNVAWVWDIRDNQKLYKYWPGKKYVDWVGVSCLNYGVAFAGQDWKKFNDLYQPFRSKILEHDEIRSKPVLLTEFGSTSLGGDQMAWMEDAFDKIIHKYAEVKGLVFYYSRQDKCWMSEWKSDSNYVCVDWTFKKLDKVEPKFRKVILPKKENAAPGFLRLISDKGGEKAPDAKRSDAIKKVDGSFQFNVDDKPYYIRGVVYNTGDFWEKGHLPLTRSILSADLRRIKEMGANTIRRYDQNIYDVNVLNIADEEDLKVIYGISLNPATDYLKDSVAKKKSLKRVRSIVDRYKDKDAVLAWTIGGPVWNELEKSYQKPYLYLVRKAYTSFVEEVIQEIRKIDPDRPVMVVLNQSPELPAALIEFRESLPSADIIGLNAYDEHYMASMSGLMEEHDPDRPYVFSEFGPQPYELTDDNDAYVYEEDADFYKGDRYFWKWVKHIDLKKGENLGGLAFCWKDLNKGIATWFGMADYKGRLKPPYYSLKKVWTGEDIPVDFPEIYIEGQDGGFVRGGKSTFNLSYITESDDFTKTEWYFSPEARFSGESLIAEGVDEVEVTLPDEPGRYRLYVFVLDSEDNVVTESKLVHIR